MFQKYCYIFIFREIIIWAVLLFYNGYFFKYFNQFLFYKIEEN